MPSPLSSVKTEERLENPLREVIKLQFTKEVIPSVKERSNLRNKILKLRVVTHIL